MKVRATSRLPRPIYRLYKESKCRDCTVVVTKMDFAKILGKFTKVKIQYESTSPKGKANTRSQSPVRNTNSRLKNIENSMVLIHRNAFKKNSIKELNSPKKPQFGKSNVLKENNTIKKSPIPKRKQISTKKQSKLLHKRYGLVFNDAKARTYEERNNISLPQLLVSIDNSLLPSENWCLEYFPKIDEPKEDAVYDKIAAELEDMYSEPKKLENAKKEDTDEFPSILDILNENVTDTTGKSDKNVSNDLPNEVEAMLADTTSKKDDTIPMEVDSAEVSTKSNIPNNTDALDKTDTSNNSLPKPPSSSTQEETEQPVKEPNLAPKPSVKISSENKSKDIKKKDRNITHIVFKLMKDGNCCKSVTCPKNLKYTIELGGKHVELLGAPKFVSSTEDLKVLLQIVNESELESFYVYH